MNHPGTDRKVRLQHQLKLQSMQIEKVLKRHNVSAQVAGGSVEPRSIIFDLQSHLTTGWDRLLEIKEELMLALGAANVEVNQANGRFHIQVDRPNEPPVALLDLLQAFVFNPMTAVLGVSEDSRPVLLEFANRRMPHVLLVGESGAGKTALLRTMAVSLAMTSRQSQVQLVVIDPRADRRARIDPLLAPLDYLPHMLAPLTVGPSETADLLNFLVGEMGYRIKTQTSLPAIVVLIDRADWLLAHAEPGLRDAIMQLAQRGEGAGIYLVLSVRQADDSALASMLKANLPVRLVGQVVDANVARMATGLAYSQAEQLLGEGDFLAVASGNATHFQAAFLDDYELHLVLEQLYARQAPPLLAQPYVGLLPEVEPPQPFVRDETDLRLGDSDDFDFIADLDAEEDEEEDELLLAFDAWGESQA